MPSRAAQIPFRSRDVDSPAGVTRETVKRLADVLGVDETAVIHRALHDLAAKVLPQYDADRGALTAAQIRAIKRRVPQGRHRSVSSSLTETGPA